MTLDEQLKASEKRANELRAKIKKQEEEKYIIIGKAIMQNSREHERIKTYINDTVISGLGKAERKKIDKLIEQKKFW